MNEPYWLKSQREELVNSLRGKGIKDERVLDAILKVPRHLFISSSLIHKAYEDIPLPIDCNQTISQPYTVAFQTELLDVKYGEKVLEIGTGCGYQAAILSLLTTEVYTIERINKLYKEAVKRLKKLGYFNVKVFYGDGNEGLKEYSPFDKIIVTAAAESIPEKLIEQLKIGGKMVIPTGKQIQEMLLITKIDEKNYTIEKHGYFTFVPLLKGKE